MEDQGRGGGEVRRIHIIYFLSRMGRIEHPHLIRVHHLSKNGVHLRDVKRWLSELRGKDMPDSFAWSYKRKYKTGYVWQDLLDDDLISPISDNEFVLKGSEISSFSFDLFSRDEEIKKRSNLKTEEVIKKEEEEEEKLDLLNKASQIDNEDSGPLDSETSTVSDDKEEKQLNIRTTKEIEKVGDDQNENSMKKSEKEKIEEESIKISSSSSSSFKKSKSYSSGATNVLRNLLNCRAVDTDDSATMLINKNNNNSSQICKFDIFGGSERISSSNGIWNHQNSYQTRRDEKSRKKSSEFGNQKKVSAAFKPVAEPHCSQCGKGFKPEKLHSHMKSCKGLKNFTKNGGAAAGIGFAHQK